VGKRLPYTPRSRVRSALRQLFLRSRERAAVVKRDKNTCTSCGKKGSVAKGKEVRTVVHHIGGIDNWEHVINEVYKHILCDPEHMQVLCEDCHKKVHEAKIYE
jgi:5-methylcytosine-specific restriction endonuclease McrA